jgi:hypothetical protein
MARQPFDPVVMWFLCVTFGLAFLVLVGASPPGHEHDPLFWFMCGNVAALAFLSVLLHNEKDEGARVGFIRLFFLADWIFGLLMAGYAIWVRVEGW